MYEATFRVGVLNSFSVGAAARTKALAMHAAHDLDRSECLVLERVDWESRNGEMRRFKVIDDAEHYPGEWNLTAV